MTNLFGVNITENKENAVIDGEVFCTDQISSEQEAQIESILETEQELEKQSSLPFPFPLLKTLCQIGWMILTLGIIKAWGDGTSFSQGYQNAPGLYLACLICFVLWLILQIISMFRRKCTEATPTYQRNDENAELLLQNIKEKLGIPADAESIDVLAERCVMKDGKPKRKDIELTQYVNLSMFAYIKEDQLCLADASSVWEIPLSSLRSMELVKKRVSFPDWTKSEPYDSKTYKPYKVTTNQFGHYFSRYYRVEISDVRGEFYLLIPEYDGVTFKDIAKMRVDE